MSDSRTSNSIKNIASGVGYQLFNLALSFVSRSVFIKTLGVSYLGISGLFGDILSMLSLADLGFGTAMTFSMYKPLAEKNYQELAGLITLYKKVYRIIAAAVAAIGLALIPFLPYLVNLTEPMEHLTLYYVLLLSNTVVSYLVVYRTCIITADQKSYVLTKYSAVIGVVQTIALIFVLLLTRNYIVYLVVQVAFGYGGNFYQSHIAAKMYPFIKESVELPKEKTRGIFRNIGSVFLYKVSSVLINATDNTLISVMVGTEWVGYYSNYNMVITKLNGIINTIFYSLTASLGNLIVKESAERRFEIFKIMQSVSTILASFCVTCVLFLEEDFVRIWLGEGFVLGKLVLAAIVLNFYFSIVLLPIWVYREAAGLYRKTKYVMLCTASVNLLASVALGRCLGLAGILFATSIARLTTYFWYEPLLLFKTYFNQPCRVYYVGLLKSAAGTLLTFAAVYFVTSWFVPQTWTMLLFKGMLVGATSLVMTLLLYCRSEGFVLLADRAKKMIGKMTGGKTT